MAGTLPEKKREEQRSTNQFTTYSYPLTPGQHNIVFIFRDYKYTDTKRGFYVDNNVNTKIGASVSLPIPQNLTDSYNVKVGPYELGAIGSVALDALQSSGREAVLADAKAALQRMASGNMVGETADANLSTLGSTFKAASAFIGRNLLDSIPGGGGISAAIDINSGTTVNPHVALKFDGVDLKQHTFTWQLSPRNERESEQIRDMILFMKARMLPNYNAAEGDNGSALSRALLTYPNIVDIFFTGINQSYFYYFKPAMINTLTTDFTPQGLALNKGGRPAMINLTMTVTESQIHTRRDIEGLMQRNAPMP